MWSESQLTALSVISEADKHQAAFTARRYMPPLYADMLDSEPGDEDSHWQYAAGLGLGWYLRDGRKVKPVLVEAQLKRTLTGLESEARLQSLDQSRLVRQWALNMSHIIKATALIGTAFALGGWARITPRDAADVERGIQSELGYLDGFADEVASGSVRRDGRFVRRALLYASAGWGIYRAVRGQTAVGRGYNEEHSILDPGAEHCGSCVGEADQGWVPIGTLIPVGNRTCRSNCRCIMQYRNSAYEVVQ